MHRSTAARSARAATSPGRRDCPSNPKTDFATLKADELSLEAAKGWLNASVKKSRDHSVLVFIHGFNNRFEDSVYRFAQIVHDSNVAQRAGAGDLAIARQPARLRL